MSAGLAEAGADSGPLEDGSLAERARTGFRLELFAPPGTVFSYANGGYDLAGHLLERLTGKPFADAMAETLFKPAGLTRSFYRPLEAFSYTASQGHVAGPDGKATVVRPIPDNVPERPSGIAFNTAEDFGRFLYLLLNEGRSPEGTQVLAPSVVAAMTARHNAMPASTFDQAYGYGISSFVADGRKILEHGGGVIGFASEVVVLPEEKLAVVVLTNGRDRSLALDVRSLIVASRTSRPLKAGALLHRHPITCDATSQLRARSLTSLSANGASGGLIGSALRSSARRVVWLCTVENDDWEFS
jgi:CubicO group peptidase (beta-lactamase class C family)